MKACIAGFGGIGKNVYYPVLKELGFDISIIDPVAPEADYLDVKLADKHYDLAIVASPNCYHHDIVEHLAESTSRILVEKPGFRRTESYLDLINEYDDSDIAIVKNNLYRNLEEEGLNSGIWAQMAMGNFDGIKSLEIKWMHKNRIPNAGGWSTNKQMSWGGVALDLFPHLYCLLFLVTNRGKYQSSWMNIEQVDYREFKQTTTLNEVKDSEYGSVNREGVLDVATYAKEHWHPWYALPVAVDFCAAWCGDEEEQSVTVHMEDGTEHKWHFGLCPVSAYKEMILSFMSRSHNSDREFDQEIHKHLEPYNELDNEN